MTEVDLPVRPAATPPPENPRLADGAAPLSLAQERLWFMEQSRPGTAGPAPSDHPLTRTNGS